MKKLALLVLVALAAGVWTSRAWAADHRDGPGVKADPAADINDVFAWMGPDANRVYLVMTVFPFATTEARFSDSAQYVFHTASGAAFGQVNPQEVAIICSFDAAQTIACSVGGSTTSVTGNAGSTDGLTSSDGKLRVFAGLRNDPFFFDFEGFSALLNTFATPGQHGDLVSSFRLGGGQPRRDSFAFRNVSAIVFEMNIDTVAPRSAGGTRPKVRVWATTSRFAG